MNDTGTAWILTKKSLLLIIGRLSYYTLEYKIKYDHAFWAYSFNIIYLFWVFQAEA